MRVVHICSAPLHPDHPDLDKLIAGWHPGKWVLHLAMAQKEYAGLEPHLVVNVPGSSCDYTAEMNGIPVHYVQCHAKWRLKTLFQYEVFRIAKKVRALEPDVVHAHGTEESNVLAAQRSGCPYIVTVQGAFFIINDQVESGPLSRQRFIELTEAWALKRALHVVAKSNYIKERLNHRFPHLKLHLIPNTYDQTLLEVATPKRSNQTLVYVGTMDRRKGIHILREALAEISDEFPDVRLWMIGGMSERDYAEYERKCLTELMGERVTFFGILPHLQVAEKVAQACCLVAPSIEEMFGNQVIEALLLQTPCLVSSDTAMAENIERFGNGSVFENGNALSLADELRRILSSSVDQNAAAEGRSNVQEYMAPQRIANKHRELYEKVLGAEGGC